ncbi:hypothetical protein RB195_003174 [Necator americanus]|uniref:Histone-lysine N-methyltransferase SETMAR n=1 Tax=Necator americanus TaxID=51031 RepID=A0ABR1DMP4_NECAM
MNYLLLPTGKSTSIRRNSRLKAGNKKLEDEPCSGRATAKLKNLAEQHPYEGVRYFAASLGCLLSTVSNGMRSRSGEKAWSVAPPCIERRQPPKTPKPLHSAALQKPQIRLVYCAQLQRLADKIRKEQSKVDNVRMLHDNARPHIAKKTSQKILELRWEVLPHPPYSPDLAPSDYHLFRSLQHHFEEKRYTDRDHLENNLRAFFASKSPEFYVMKFLVVATALVLSFIAVANASYWRYAHSGNSAK